MQKPELLPSLADYLKDANISPVSLGVVLLDYLEVIREAIHVDYSPHEDPYGFLLAETYRQAIGTFSDILNRLDTDDTTRMEKPTQQGKRQLGIAEDEIQVRAGNGGSRQRSGTDMAGAGSVPARTRTRAATSAGTRDKPGKLPKYSGRQRG